MSNSEKNKLSENLIGSLVECSEWDGYPGMFGNEYAMPENMTGSLVLCAEWTNFPGMLGVVVDHSIEWDELKVFVAGKVKSFSMFDLYCLS